MLLDLAHALSTDPERICGILKHWSRCLPEDEKQGLIALRKQAKVPDKDLLLKRAWAIVRSRPAPAARTDGR